MVQQKRGINPLALVLSLSAVFFVIFMIVSAALFMTRGSGKRGAGLFGKGSVGVIEVEGVIMDSRRTLERIEAFKENENIKALVVRVNSPGGAVAPSQEIFSALRDFEKPVVVSMGSIAASGGYYIAVAADKIFANPGTITGSIGVIMDFVNLEQLYEWAKIKRYALTTGKFKAIGAEYKDMTPAERELLQTMIDTVLMQFKQAVAEGRKLSLENVTAVADGRIMSGEQAKKLNLVDELGTINDAIEEAAKLAKIEGKPNVVYPEKRRRKLLDLLLDERMGDPSEDVGMGASLLQALRALLGGSDAPFAQRPLLQPGIYWLWRGSY